MTRDGNPKDDQEITEKRAKSIVAWLEASGIAAARLDAKGYGRSRPLTENDTPQEIEQNERIELIKNGS